MTAGVEAVILGSAQDGGMPHAGCLCPACQAARDDPRQRRLPASLGLRSGDAWAIVDTTSAFEQQLYQLWRRRPGSERHASERFGAPDAIVLTHAHPGHFVGLWQLDRSVLAGDNVPVYCPPAMAEMLRGERLWGGMEQDGFIQIKPLQIDEQIELLPGIAIEPLLVPHRSELGVETVALLIQGPARSLLYLPDIDSWDAWDQRIEDVCRSVDVAVLDGCFWDAPPAPGAPHPPIVETMGLLGDLISNNDCDVIFTHLNHSNPVLRPGSSETTEVARRGFSFAGEGMALEL